MTHSHTRSDSLLEQAVTALNEGRKGKARDLLQRVVGADRHSELGWLLLSEVADSSKERRSCLVRALSINRDNVMARQRLRLLLSEGPLEWQQPTVRLNPGWFEEALHYDEPVLSALRSRAVPLAFGVPLIYLACLLIAEVLTTLLDPQMGLLLYAVLLVALFVHTALTWQTPFYRLLLGLALAPLIRIMSLVLPLDQIPLIYWYLITSLPLFAATFMAARVLQLGLDDVGLNLKRPLLQLAVVLLGGVLGYIEYHIMRPAPLVPVLTWKSAWLPALILLVCTGFAEELIFRGVIQPVVRLVLKQWAVVYVAFLFAVLHIGYRSVADVVFVFGVGLIFGLIRDRTHSIVGISFAHGVTNIALLLVLPFWG